MQLYQDKSCSIEDRINDLYERMTNEEKYGQMNMSWFYAFKNEDESHTRVGDGEIGAFILSDTPWPGNITASGLDIDYFNRLQKSAVENSRLGIPLLFGRDIIHGHRTIAPIPLAQAASFDPEVARLSAELSAKEATAEGVKWTFAPMMDICRDPRWGRVIETFGEDPYLASEMAIGAVKGYQGDNPADSDRMLACAKHFAGYGYAEGGRDYDSCELSHFTLHNVVLRPFKAAIDKADVASVMNSFQVTGGTPANSDTYILKNILRDNWKFSGMVVSDFGSVDEITLHGGAQDNKDAVYKAVHSGTDMEMCDFLYPQHLATLHDEGKITDAEIERAVKAVLRCKFKAGLFDNPYIDTTRINESQVNQNSRDEVRKLAASCMVLAKNNNLILPLDPDRKCKIAIVGPMAHERRSLLGAWSGNGIAEDTPAIVDAFSRYNETLKLLSTTSQLTDEQLRLVKMADVVICCVGEGQRRTGEAHAVSRLKLPVGQEELIESIGEFGKPMIVVCTSGRPLPMKAAEQYADAILYSWHSGTETANAIADIIFGKTEPTGRFPITVPRHEGQIPLYYGRKVPGKVTKPFLVDMGYSFYDDEPFEPVYPFGFGLSYSEFSLSEISVKHEQISLNETNEASVICTNTGKRRGTAVVQCYLRDRQASYARPYKELIGFQKVTLDTEECIEVKFIINEEAMGFYDENGNRLIEPGEFNIGIGFSSSIDMDHNFILK